MSCGTRIPKWKHDPLGHQKLTMPLSFDFVARFGFFPVIFFQSNVSCRTTTTTVLLTVVSDDVLRFYLLARMVNIRDFHQHKQSTKRYKTRQ